MLRELLPLCGEVVCTASANPRALPPATLQSLCGQLGGAARADGAPTRAARWSRRARPPGPTASRWPPARST